LNLGGGTNAASRATKSRGTAAADVDDGSGAGLRDGGVTIDDLLYFLGRYGSGC